MKRSKFALAAAAALATSLFATDAMAELEARASISATMIGITENSSKIVDGQIYRETAEFDDPMVGVVGTLAIGYRFSSVGIYIEQDLGGAWWTGATSDLPDFVKYTDSSFIGGTYLTFKFIAPMGKLDIDCGFGLGAMYSAGPKHTDPDYNRVYTIIVDNNMDPGAAFALRLTAGFTYFFAKKIGIGLHMDYNIGFNYVKPNKLVWGNVSRYDATIHQFNPGLHIGAKF